VHFRDLGCFSFLAHDRVALAAFHCALDLRILMAGHDGELRRLGADGLVFGKRQADGFDAVLVPTLAEEVESLCDLRTRLQFLDPLIDLAEEDLVVTDSFFPVHVEVLSPTLGRNALPRIRLGRHPPRLPDLLHGREAVALGDDVLIIVRELVAVGDGEAAWASADRLVLLE
jgi:hypothetical protein